MRRFVKLFHESDPRWLRIDGPGALPRIISNAGIYEAQLYGRPLIIEPPEVTAVYTKGADGHWHLFQEGARNE